MNFNIIKESDLPLDQLPAPKIWLELKPGQEVREIFMRIMRTMACDINRPLALQVRRGDRYEVYERFMRLLKEKPRLGRFRFVPAHELHRVLEDTNPDPTVVIDGENVAPRAQSRFVQRLRKHPHHTARTTFLTEADPGELFERGVWSGTFRKAIHQTHRFPALRDRDSDELRQIIRAFMFALQHQLERHHGTAFTIESGGLDFFTEVMIGLEPESVHRLLTACQNCINELLTANTHVLSGETFRKVNLTPSVWNEATGQMDSSGAVPINSPA